MCTMPVSYTEETKFLSDNCRSNSCIEHAAGIMEEEKIPEKLSKGVSTISLTGREKKMNFVDGIAINIGDACINEVVALELNVMTPDISTTLPAPSYNSFDVSMDFF